MKRILIAGESWMSYTTHVKGFDAFYTSTYEEGVKWLQDALIQGGYEVDFMPNHKASAEFPSTMESLSRYDALFLSDIGSNTLLISDKTFIHSQCMPNRCDLIKNYVLGGGGFCMVGGYLSFSGIDGKARYGQTAVAEVLPVRIFDADDRVELPQGAAPVVTAKEHPILKNIPKEWPCLLGYNKTGVLDGGDVIATIHGDPFVAAKQFGQGRSVAFTSDCSPHWAPPAFVDWPYYKVFWKNVADYLTAE